MLTTKGKEFFDSIKPEDVCRYMEYWQSVAPKNEEEHYQRWLFAYMSVHTSWKSNVRGYQAIKRFKQWEGDKDKLFHKIEKARVGFQNNRTRFIMDFHGKFWNNLSDFMERGSKTWTEWRDHLVKNILGLGNAKTSFGLEMAFPNECEVSCMDTHLFQFYGLDQSKDAKRYKEIESDWINQCQIKRVPSYIARCLYWDKNQNRKNSRYWSYCLEK
jgi:thermostable 8-oxoguanine DNA glycosylase